MEWSRDLLVIATTTSPMEIAILVVYFNGSFQGETWLPLDDYLVGITQPPIDWNEPVTFEVDERPKRVAYWTKVGVQTSICSHG